MHFLFVVVLLQFTHFHKASMLEQTNSIQTILHLHPNSADTFKYVIVKSKYTDNVTIHLEMPYQFDRASASHKQNKTIQRIKKIASNG